MPRVRLLSRRRLVGCVALGIGAMRNGAAFAETTRERILRDHKLTLGIHNSSPWGFRGADGQVTGFHPDLVRAAFAPLGVTSVEFTVTDFGALIPGLVANRFDIVASGLGITPARCQVVAFSDPDLSIGDAIIVKAGNPLNLHSYADIVANPAVKLGASRGSANGKNAQLAGVPESRMLLFQNTEATFAALQAGRVDAITFSSPTAIGLLKDPNVTGIERALPFRGHVKPNGREAALYSALAFRQTDLDLRDLYDKRLAEMKADGTLAKLMGGYGFGEAEKAPDLTQRQICGGED
ncbi:amino acid ABC transporter substrate-binding protein, PAAT family [Rhizobiales bacterium GAS191]|jgi:polar amino acid transport system substrate-binding protein|nr:amino acid ABC transporter substrate-binding protein, PAAT family [Rhizobiales bacterium GAS188]SED18044.1 amino acid ABC transporter substrate-binding protein, PAAT family [Rhizobiales bacterium GAS191]